MRPFSMIRARAWYENPSPARRSAEVVTPFPRWGSVEAQNVNRTAASCAGDSAKVLEAKDEGFSRKTPAPESAPRVEELTLDHAPPVVAVPQLPEAVRSN